LLPCKTKQQSRDEEVRFALRQQPDTHTTQSKEQKNRLQANATKPNHFEKRENRQKKRNYVKGFVVKLKEGAKNVMRRQRVAISVCNVNVAALVALNLGDAEKSPRNKDQLIIPNNQTKVFCLGLCVGSRSHCRKNRINTAATLAKKTANATGYTAWLGISITLRDCVLRRNQKRDQINKNEKRKSLKRKEISNGCEQASTTC
jgi:hypothetical protein